MKKKKEIKKDSTPLMYVEDGPVEYPEWLERMSIEDQMAWCIAELGLSSSIFENSTENEKNTF